MAVPLAVFASAVVLRLINLFALRNTYLFNHLIGDAREYDCFAWQFLRGEIPPEGLLINLSPLYVFFLQFSYGCFGHNLLAPKLMQVFAGGLTCVLIYKIAETVWCRRTAVIAGFAAACYGILIFYDGQLQKPALAVFFAVATLYYLILTVQRQRLVWAGLAGFCFAGAVLLRDHFWILLPCVLGWMLWCGRERLPFRKRLNRVLIFSAVFVAHLGLWLGYAQFMRPQHSGAEYGIHFYIGNNPRATGVYKSVPGVRNTPQGHSMDARKIVEKELGRAAGNVEVNIYWIRKGLSFILENPAEWLRIQGRKLFLALNAYEVPHDESFDFTRKESWLLQMCFVAYGVVCPLGLLGILLSRPNRNEGAVLLFLYVVFYLLSLLIFFVSSAYRLPLQPVLLLFAAHAVSRFFSFVETRDLRGILISAALFGLFYFYVNQPTFLDPERYERFMHRKIDFAAKRAEREKG